MRILRHISPEWALRVSLGTMYLYSGIDLFRHPTAWHWALPYWLRESITPFMDIDTYLQFQGAVEIIFALVLLCWFVKQKFVQWVALLSTLEFATILLLAFVPWSETNFLITFRDIGLLGAAYALFLLLARNEPTTR